MESKDFSTVNARLKSNKLVYFLFFVMGISLIAMFVMFIATESFFFLAAFLMFVLVTGLNFFIIRRRARYYLQKVVASPDKLEITYYNGNEYNVSGIRWTDIDFFFGYVRGDYFLVLWERNELKTIFFRSFGNQGVLFPEIYKALVTHIAADKITYSNYIYIDKNMPRAYTKRYIKLFL